MHRIEARPDRIGRQHKAERLGREDFAADIQHQRQMVEQLPDFTMGAAAEFRRVGEDDIVVVAAALLTLDELHGVFADPADGRLFKPRKRLVLLRPANRFLGGVDMGHFRASCRRNQRGDAGVTEEVQHFQRPVGRFDGMFQPFPMHDLFGKDANMPEGREAAEKFDPEQGQRPCLAERFLRKAPAAHAVLIGIAGKDGIGILPYAVRDRRLPESLRFGTDDAVIAILFKLQAVAAIDQMKITRAARFQNDRNLFRGTFAGAGLRGRAGACSTAVAGMPFPSARPSARCARHPARAFSARHPRDAPALRHEPVFSRSRLAHDCPAGCLFSSMEIFPHLPASYCASK
ncbi:hypothetical protein Ddc_22841 [Ditylenchus destructor]|nr:hypothetical protein Ddc_22841 [Ditylenchus destructor]